MKPLPKPIRFDQLITPLFEQFKHLPDHRTGQNNRYTLEDAAKGAFALFFTQSASFLAHQQLMK
ncbi:MAG: hypothetical protein L6R45_36105 [Anaerolineae bacterium]|nr:hypothetical protein [Anaerolineae bacterium]